MSIPLEDNFADIIGKAQRGLSIADSELSSRSGLPVERIQKVRDGEFDEEAITQLAPILGLSAVALKELYEGWHPAYDLHFEGFGQFRSPYKDFIVNSYLLWNPTTKRGIAFDTGSDCSDMLDTIRKEALTVEAIFLTHTDGDHIFDLDRLQEKTRARAFVSQREPIDGAEIFSPGERFAFAGFEIETRSTWGHSPGGTTYVVNGMPVPIAVVGDAVFAGSMGGGVISFKDALETNRKEIFTLPEETVICPGHGPVSTVGLEKKHNPFYSTR